MTSSEMLQRATQLASEIREGGQQDRLALHPELSRLLNALRATGEAVPRVLLQLDAELNEEEVEQQFDNMPV